MVLADTPQYLDGAGDSYHVSGRAWREGHGARADSWPARDAEVFGACAAAALYRRGAFDDAGGFDEPLFLYFEDVDLAFRLRLRGHRCVVRPFAVVTHVGSAFSGYRSNFAVYHGERNAIWTFMKNMPGPLLWLYLPQHLLINAAALLYYPRRGQGRWRCARSWTQYAGCPSVLCQRRIIQASRVSSARSLRRAFRRNPFEPYRRNATLPSP